MRSASVCWFSTISVRRFSASALITASVFSASAICRSSSRISSAFWRAISSSRCSRSRAMRAVSRCRSRLICSRSVCSRHLELGFVERAAAGDFAPLRLFFAADALLGDGALLRQSRLLDRLRARRAAPLRPPARGAPAPSSAPRAARRGGIRPRAPARAGRIRSRDRSRRPSFALPDSGCGYRPACAARSRCASCAAFRSISVSWVRPSASNAFDGSKYSRLV